MPKREATLEDKQRWMRDRHSSSRSTQDDSSLDGGPFEAHYTVADLAQRWKLSPDAVRRLFEEEPSILMLGGNRPGKRRYTTLRIPKSVAERVYRRNLQL